MSSRRRDLVEKIRPQRSSGSGRAAGLLALDLGAYGALWFALLIPMAWWWKAMLAVGAGVAIARLFLIGHDACHGAFFPREAGGAGLRSRLLPNALVGRLVFLPSLTPYSTWELGHNTLHHGFTNLRGKDYVYTPFTKDEFDTLPGWRRMLERIYRHPLGPGLHYGIEVWWKHLWFPGGSREGVKRAIYTWDSVLTLAFLLTQLAMVVYAAQAAGEHPATLALWALLLPFAVWNMLMGFVTYQQHTHPQAVWYADRHQWDPVTAQVHGTVHVEFPAAVGALLGNIMEHTAHHLDAAVPMFDLPEAQRRVELELPGEVTRVRWSMSYYLDCCRRCKLYDYASQTWTGFDGRPVRPGRRWDNGSGKLREASLPRSR